MDVERDFKKMLSEILEKDERYSVNAYVFIRHALDYTLITMGIKGHVTGQELLQGIRQFALEKFGPMAKFILDEWGVKNCRDFGSIVFNMVDAALLGKTEEDSIEDFDDGYDFSEAFEKPFK